MDDIVVISMNIVNIFNYIYVISTSNPQPFVHKHSYTEITAIFLRMCRNCERTSKAVLGAVLHSCIESIFLSSLGNEFHPMGPLTANELCPNNFVRISE